MTASPSSSTLAGRFVHPGDPLWSEVLQAAPHDFYHLPGYVELAAAWEGGTPRAYVYGDGARGMLLPLVIHGRGGDREATTPYGYSSPVFAGRSSAEHQREALAAFVEDGQGVGLKTTFARLHPVLQPTVPDGDGVWRVVENGETVAVPLDRAPDAWLAAMRKGHRYEIRRLRRAGYTVRVDDERDWGPFCAVYAETMQRLGASASYHFTSDYFDRLREALGPALHWAAVLDADGDVAAAGLLPVVGDVMQYHLSGTAAAHQALSPSKLMLAEMGEWARARGVSVFHLGGGVGGARDSLYRFKVGFAGDTVPFRTLRIVHDRPAFEARSAAWLAEHGVDAFPDPLFFPPYRQRPAE